MNRTVHVALSLLALLVCPGCVQPPSPQGRAQFVLAQRQFDAQQFPMAIQTLSNFLDREAHCSLAPAAYYQRGLSYRSLTPPTDSRNDMAERDFRQVLRQACDPQLSGRSHVALGNLYFEPPANDPGQAIDHYSAALPLLEPNAPPTDLALYRLACAQQMIGQWHAADLHLARCFDVFVDSPWAEKSRRRFGARIWRIQLGSFSELTQALARIDQLKRDGYLGDWTAQLSQGTVRYVIHTGRFGTYADAVAVLPQLAALQGDAWITPTPSNTISPP